MKATRTHEPVDRLSRIADAILSAGQNHPELDEQADRCIVFMRSDKEHMTGIAMAGYGDKDAEKQATVDLLMYLKQLFNSQGKEIAFLPLA